MSVSQISPDNNVLQQAQDALPLRCLQVDFIDMNEDQSEDIPFSRSHIRESESQSPETPMERLPHQEEDNYLFKPDQQHLKDVIRILKGSKLSTCTLINPSFVLACVHGIAYQIQELKQGRQHQIEVFHPNHDQRRSVVDLKNSYFVQRQRLLKYLEPEQNNQREQNNTQISLDQQLSKELQKIVLDWVILKLKEPLQNSISQHKIDPNYKKIEFGCFNKIKKDTDTQIFMLAYDEQGRICKRAIKKDYIFSYIKIRPQIGGQILIHAIFTHQKNSGSPIFMQNPGEPVFLISMHLGYMRSYILQNQIRQLINRGQLQSQLNKLRKLLDEISPYQGSKTISMGIHFQSNLFHQIQQVIQSFDNLPENDSEEQQSSQKIGMNNQQMILKQKHNLKKLKHFKKCFALNKNLKYFQKKIYQTPVCMSGQKIKIEVGLRFFNYQQGSPLHLGVKFQNSDLLDIQVKFWQQLQRPKQILHQVVQQDSEMSGKTCLFLVGVTKDAFYLSSSQIFQEQFCFIVQQCQEQVLKLKVIFREQEIWNGDYPGSKDKLSFFIGLGEITYDSYIQFKIN